MWSIFLNPLFSFLRVIKTNQENNLPPTSDKEQGSHLTARAPSAAAHPTPWPAMHPTLHRFPSASSASPASSASSASPLLSPRSSLPLTPVLTGPWLKPKSALHIFGCPLAYLSLFVPWTLCRSPQRPLGRVRNEQHLFFLCFLDGHETQPTFTRSWVEEGPGANQAPN